MLKMLSCFVVTAFMLGACGGGSDSPTNNTGGGSGGGGNATTYQLSLTSVGVNQCNEESPLTTSRVVIHNADFTERTVLNPNSNGQFSYSTSDSHVSFSLVSYREIEPGIFQTNIQTTISAPTTDLGVFYTNHEVDVDCGCYDDIVTVVVPDLVGEIEETTVYLGGSQTVSDVSQRTTDGVQVPLEICRNNGESIITGNVSIVPQMLSRGIMPQQFVSGMTVEASLDTTAISVNSQSANSIYKYTYSYIDGIARYSSTDSTYDDDYLYLVNEPTIDAHEINVTTSDTFYHPEFDFGFYIIARTDMHNDIASQYEMPLADVNVEKIVDVVLAEDSQYDVSGEMPSADLFRVSTALQTETMQESLVWGISMPVVGEFPNIDNWDPLEYLDTSSALLGEPDSLNLDVILVGYENAQTYDDFLINQRDFESGIFDVRFNQYELAVIVLETGDTSQFEAPLVSQRVTNLVRHNPNRKSADELASSNKAKAKLKQQLKSRY